MVNIVTPSKTMLELTKERLEEYGIFNNKLSPLVDKLIETIPYATVPYKMKAIIAISELITYASQFRRNIILWDSASVPINTISFVLTHSGANKDSSVSAIRKCFKQGYSQLNEHRLNLNIKNAQRKAKDNGEDFAESAKVYGPYLDLEPPFFMSTSSAPGFIQHINDLGVHPLGAGLLYSGEFGDELAYNQDMTECIKVLAETYDLGNKEVKYTKGKEFRSKEIIGQPVSALLVSSPMYIIYDESVKRKFNIAFMSKLARRSWFCYIPQMLKEKTYNSLEDMLREEERTEALSNKAREQIITHVKQVTDYNIKKLREDLSVSHEVSQLFKIYKRYNSEIADSMINNNSTEMLIRKHLQWKALKFAGALAIFNNQDTVSLDNYIDAIKYSELLANDMKNFEHELNKAEYEKFADYINLIASTSSDSKISITTHKIKKMGFIKTINKNILQDLITSAASYDLQGIYQLNADNTEITYEKPVKTKTVGISFKEIDLTQIEDAIKQNKSKETIGTLKSNIAKTVHDGFQIADTTFPELQKMLEVGGYAYSPFKFQDGIRRKDKVITQTNWLVLDIDKSEITAGEADFMLQDINHHIALSSNPANEFKFRAVIEMDSNIEIEGITWTYFYKLVGDYLGLNIDPLPQSQIFYAYTNREVLSVTDQEPLKIRDFIMKAHEIVNNKIDINKIKKLSPAKKKVLIQDEFNTFEFAFDAEFGEGSRQLIRAARKAYFDLGLNKEETVNLVNKINDYWVVSMEEQRFQNTIINQINRW